MHVYSGDAGLSSDDVWLTYTVQLPFIPFQGLTISDPDLDGELVCENLTWVTKHQYFLTFMEDKTLYKYSMLSVDKRPPVEPIVQQYVDTGWSIQPPEESLFD